jgi:hypothetical protein
MKKNVKCMRKLYERIGRETDKELRDNTIISINISRKKLKGGSAPFNLTFSLVKIKTA